jgi:electron transport complex protein RnfD
MSPIVTATDSVTRIMARVLAALVPGIAAYAWLFGPGILVTLTIATLSALGLEALMLRLRGVPVSPFLKDLSAVVTAWLLALSLPPIAPWWLVVVGVFFAIVVAKHLYGGLGSNPFNPAMVGFAVLIVSFPAQMTQWPAPHALAAVQLGFPDVIRHIFGGGFPAGVAPDTVTMATPLDTLKTQLKLQHTAGEIFGSEPIFGILGGVGGETVALMFLVGGLYLWASRVITWHVPFAFLAGIFLVAGLFHVADTDRYVSPWFHYATPSIMLGAFFIATDPVSGAATPRGRLLFGAGAGALTAFIRIVGGYPDGVAFAVLLMNICVPLIDLYTQPPVFGERQEVDSQ